MSTTQLPRVLFVCVHNAGRSQMAQAFWRSMGGDARSAGSDPAHEVNPVVVMAMREIGIDITGTTPRRLEDADAQWADVVVTMGCGDACPYIAGKRYIDWELPDPAGADEQTVRHIRDEIRSRVQALVEEN